MNVVHKNSQVPKVITNARQRIIDEFEGMILDETTDLSIREVARRVGFAVGTIYNYFPNKDELIQALFQREWERALTGMIPKIRNAPPAEAIDRVVRTVYEEMRRVAVTKHRRRDFARVVSDKGEGSHYADDTGRPPYPVRREALQWLCNAFRPVWREAGWTDQREIDRYTVCLVTTAHRLIAVFPEEHEGNIAFLRGLIAKGEHESATE
jgi:AcrR family transcriptional regulator